MECWKCGAKHELFSGEKVSFRAVCDGCGIWLHSCMNCRYHKVGRPNECMIPGTIAIHDREKVNFCDEFQPKEGGAVEAADPDEASKRLFGESSRDVSSKKSPEERFKSLFDD
jgi:hypothetical protein